MKYFLKNAVERTYHFLRKFGSSPAEANFTIFSDIEFLNTLPSQQLKKLYDLGHPVSLAQGEHLFKEGETPNEFYVVVEGLLEVYKYDKKYHLEHRISTLSSGQPVGEMALIDNCPRSANVRASTDAKLYCIPFSAITKLIQEGHNFDRVYHPLSKILSQRLRVSNEVIIQSLEKQVEDYKLRVLMGHFMVNVITMLSLFVILLSSLSYITKFFSTASIMTIILTAIFSGAMYVLIKTSKLPLSSFGITTQNWRQAIYESILFTTPFLILTLILKWLEIQFVPSMANESLFSPFSYLYQQARTYTDMSVVGTWSYTLIIYIFLIAPFQELVARGGLQGPLESFLTGKYKKWVAILVSNLIFCVVHAHLSIYIAIMVFVPGLLFGWLYSRHKTLIGVVLSHIMLGAWAFWIVGVYV